MLSLLIEDLDAVVRAVADKQPAAGIHGQRVRLLHLSRTAALLPERLDELAFLGELQDARVGAAMAFGNEDLTVRRDEHVVRLIEVLRLCRAARLAERHQQLALRAELEAPDDRVSNPEADRYASPRNRAGRPQAPHRAPAAARRPDRRSPTRCPRDRRACRAGRSTSPGRSWRPAFRTDRTSEPTAGWTSARSRDRDTYSRRIARRPRCSGRLDRSRPRSSSPRYVPPAS